VNALPCNGDDALAERSDALRPRFESEYMTTDELAAYIRTPAETVRYWRHMGAGPKAFKLGRRVLYDRADVQEWLAEARRTRSTT
jgi:excisionase family DNA binding protein